MAHSLPPPGNPWPTLVYFLPRFLYILDKLRRRLVAPRCALRVRFVLCMHDVGTYEFWFLDCAAAGLVTVTIIHVGT